MKTITIKSYTGSTFNGIIKDATFSEFTKTINNGLGICTLQLARTFDNFNPAGDVSLGNKIEIWVYDEDTGNDGVLLYSGFIEQQIPNMDGGSEGVNIICAGLISKLAQDVLKSAAYTTLQTDATSGLISSGSATAVEIQNVVKAIIDRYAAENGAGGIRYSTDGGVESVAATGVLMSYIFQAKTYFDALNICKDAAPQNWYFFIGADGVINFKLPAATPDHNFVVGKHIKKIEVQKGIDSTKNILLFYAPDISIYKQYKSDTSISLYGRRVEQKQQTGIQDAATMDAIGDAFINENKDPRVRVELEIIDNNEDPALGYDIESIDPGDTCKISGITYGDLLPEIMTITEVRWNLGVVNLTVETREDFDIDKFILNLQKDVTEQQQDNIAANYI